MGIIEEAREDIEEFADPLLRINGVTPELARILRDYGYYTVESIAVEAPHILFERVGERGGFSLEKARQICRAARSLLQIKPITVAELMEEEKQRIHISTGSRSLNVLLSGFEDGGVRTGELTGVSGAYGVGKTALVLTLAVNTVKDLGAGAWIIDTEGAIGARRIGQIAEARGVPKDVVIQKIYYYRSYGTEDLIAAIEEGHRIIKERNIRFIGIDTFVNPFRIEYVGRDKLPERQAKMNRCLHRLVNYARIYNLAVLLTNQVVSKPEASPFEHRPEVIEPPTGGHVFMYSVNNHLYLRKGLRGRHIATLIDSSYMPRGETVFTIGKAGIIDVEE